MIDTFVIGHVDAVRHVGVSDCSSVNVPKRQEATLISGKRCVKTLSKSQCLCPKIMQI